MLQSVLRSASAVSIAAGFAVTALSVQSASAEQWAFERIAQSGDSLPHNNNVVIDSIESCGIENGNVVYSGNAHNGGEGTDYIAALVKGVGRTVVFNETPVPDGVGVFAQNSGGHLDGDCIVFTGRDSGRGGPPFSGVYRYHPAAKLHRVVDTNSMVPMRPGDFYTGFFSAVADDDTVIALTDVASIGPIERAFFQDDNGEQTLPVIAGMLLPNGETLFTINEFDFNAGLLASRVLAEFGVEHILLNSESGSELLASDGDLVPDGAVGEVFNSFASPVVNSDGDQTAFIGVGDMGTIGIFSKESSSTLELVIGLGDPAPPTFTDTFDLFSTTIAINNGAHVFLASTTENDDRNLYTTLGATNSDEPKLVLAVGDMLDGKTVVAIDTPGRQALSGLTLALCVRFDDFSDAVYTATLIQESFETEPNNSIDTANCIELLSDCAFVSGKLQSNEFPACDPDTVLVAFDKQINFLEDDAGIRLINDDDATEGDGRASALWDIPLVPGSGSSTLRLGVTGKADVVESNVGTAGDFNGLNQNFPHGQLGEFTLTVTFVDDMGMALPSPTMLPDGSMMENPIQYVDEFRTGGEAFYINYMAPIGADAAHAVIDNTTGRDDFCNDVDFFLFKNLIPLCPYCVVQIGGLNDQCTQTDGLLAWFSPKQLINTTDDNSGDGVYASLCDPDAAVTADINGIIRIAFSGSGDTNFNGLLDGPAEDQYLADHPEYLNDYPGLPPAAAPIIDMGGQPLSSRAIDLVCADPPPAHGECGCYTLKISLDLDAHEDPPNLLVLQEAMYHGDINLDGITDTADLGILVGFFGWAAP